MVQLSDADRTKPGYHGSGDAYIQACDNSGNWFTNCVTPIRSPLGIQQEMKQLKQRYPEFRVRAIDSRTGQLIDFLA